MKKLTKLQKQIINAHLKAKAENIFLASPDFDGSLDQVKQSLLRGDTIRWIYETIEYKYCSVGSIILSSGELFNHQSQNYKANIRYGFKILFSNLNIE